MSDIADKLKALGGFAALLEGVRAGRRVAVRGPTGSAAALLVGALMEELEGVALAVCPGVEYAEEFAEDVNLVRDGLACHFPALEILPGDEEPPNEAIVKARLSVLRHLVFGTACADGTDFLEPRPGTKLVCVSAGALLQPTAGVDELRRGARSLAVGDEVAPRELVEWFVESGFYSVPQVTGPGQYSLRGGILDVFSHGAESPVRIEFFGDQVDSIRTFDRRTQLSRERVEGCQLMASRDPLSDPSVGSAQLLSYLPEGSPVFVVEPEQTWQRAEELAAGDARGFLLSPVEMQRRLASRPMVSFLPERDGEAEGAVRIRCRQRDVFGIDLDGALSELERIVGEFARTYLLCAIPAEQERLVALLKDREFGPVERIRFHRGRLNHGVLFPEDGLAFVPHHRLFGRYRQRRLLRHAEEARPVTEVSELRPGDTVVHVLHGIARFTGTRVLESDGRRLEHLVLEFADGVRVYVPSDRVEMVHRYIGVGGRKPELSRLHGAHWRAARRRAEQAVRDLAAELLRIQAVRQSRPGIAFPADDEWQRQFESEFPYEETEDQLRAIEQVKADMMAPRPMDRLICGDVGYGKTEIAMRAAFKAVMAGRQVAVLVPTTVLAQQHYRTFRERMADYPIRVEMLSRFVTPAQARQILEGMAGGQVDIVIGTHRLLQKDVGFKDLGLVIVDEEQRFGVKHKERLKRMRSTVDVLTLTATPIPRTLHMAVMGLRDISSLQTPPLDRQAVETRVRTFDPRVLRDAVLRELRREGQVFLVHNRVHSIEAVAETVRRLVPQARVEVAHGQMPERRLADVMERFAEDEVDVLVSTTIIENGLDIPNANTLVINRAELLGLAEMHQLRGRVGRYIHKAYAYFFTPPDRPITPEARERLEAIRRYSDLGAGFDIALRDLEIRGAGNILGPEQSGHIAAVGYNLYCRLLARATARLKGEAIPEPPSATVNLGLDTLVPESYVPTLQQRIEIYREVSRAADPEQVRLVGRGLRDRFGPPPQPVRDLLLEAEIRIMADRAGVDSIQVRDGRLHFSLKDPQGFRAYFASAAIRPRLVGEQEAVIEAPRGDARATARFVRQMFVSA